MNSYEKMLAHVWIELNSKINKIEAGEISPEDRAKLNAIPASASSSNPVALASQIPDVTSLTNRVTAAEGDIDDIQAVIPSGASSSDKLALSSEIPDITSLTNRVTAAEGDIDDIQAVIPSGASTSNKLATASDIPTVKSVETISIILPGTGWSISPDPDGYYTQSYTIIGKNFDPDMHPFVFGTNNEFNLIDKCDIFNYDGYMNFTAYVKTVPNVSVTLDLYFQK